MDNKPYKVIKAGYGIRLEKHIYVGNEGIRYVEIMNRNTGKHFKLRSYLPIGYCFDRISKHFA